MKYGLKYKPFGEEVSRKYPGNKDPLVAYLMLFLWLFFAIYMSRSDILSISSIKHFTSFSLPFNPEYNET
jgi:hypothetical protein